MIQTYRLTATSPATVRCRFYDLLCGTNYPPGGAQSYCCSGFVPSQIANTDSISLLGDYRGVEDDEQELSARLMPFGINSNKMACASTVGVSLLGSLGKWYSFSPVHLKKHHGWHTLMREFMIPQANSAC